MKLCDVMPNISNGGAEILSYTVIKRHVWENPEMYVLFTLDNPPGTYSASLVFPEDTIYIFEVREE